MDSFSPTRSTARDTELSTARFFVRLFCACALPVVLAIGLAALVVFWSGDGLTADTIAHRQDRYPDLLWAGPQRLYSAIKYARMEADKPDVLAIGASRSGQVRSAEFKPYSFYNASMSGWGFDRLYTMLDDDTRTQPPKVVIFNLDYFMFGSHYEERWLKTENDMPLYYGVIDANFEGIRSLAQAIRTRPLQTLTKLGAGPVDPPDNRLDGLRLFGALDRMDRVSAFRHDGSILYLPSYLSQAGSAAKTFSTVLAQVEPGTGGRIDPAQIQRLRKLAALAHRRSFLLVGVQLPYPKAVVDMLDSDEDYTEGGHVFPASDRRVWKDFETAHMRQLIADMGIIFLDFARLPEAAGPGRFVDTAHPGEYLDLISMIGLLKQPDIRRILPAIDLGALEAIRDKAAAEGNYFDIFRGNF